MYKGSWRNDQRDGQGIIKYSNGDKYEGNWKNNQMNGYGIYSTNDITYEGFFFNDIKDGKFKITYKSGKKVEAVFKNDVLLNPVKIWFENGDCYSGEYYNNCLNGNGYLKKVDG